MATQIPMSRFVQNYNQHLGEAERTDAVLELKQRGGRPTWVLESKVRFDAAAEAADFLAAALVGLVQDDTLTGRFVDLLAQSLPWLAFLPPSDQQTFAVEAADTLRACASIGRFTAFVALVDDWRSTAEVWSDPELARELATAIDQPINVAVDTTVQ